MSDTGQKKVLIQKEVFINEILKAFALDINEDGMYITTPAELLPEAIIDLRFEILGSTLRLKAVVHHTDHGIGMGVKFINLPHESKVLIKRFMEQTGAGGAAPDKPGKKTLLLVDDSDQSRLIYKNKLNLEGFQVAEAASGVDALRYLQQNKPDLVILDLWMEGIDGFKILQMMNLNPELKKIPVIVLSARVVPADIEKVIALGAKDFLPKMTTTPIKLAQKVKEVLSFTS